MLTKLKEMIQSYMKSGAIIAYRVGLTPNLVSSIGAILGLASGIFYWKAGSVSFQSTFFGTYLLLATFLLFASGFCDILDGALARLFFRSSPIGGFLDSLLDRYIDSAIYVGIILGGLCDPLWGILTMIGSLLTSYTRARSEAADIPMETVGILERAERLIIIAASSLLSMVWISTLRWAMIILALTTNFTVFQRAIYFFKKSRSFSTK